jgi:hypothetical protein
MRTESMWEMDNDMERYWTTRRASPPRGRSKPKAGSLRAGRTPFELALSTRRREDVW